MESKSLEDMFKDAEAKESSSLVPSASTIIMEGPLAPADSASILAETTSAEFPKVVSTVYHALGTPEAVEVYYSVGRVVLSAVHFAVSVVAATVNKVKEVTGSK